MEDFKTLFYWISVADNLKGVLKTFAIIFTIIFSLSNMVRFVMWFYEDSESFDSTMEKCNKWTWYSTPLMLFFIFSFILLPSRKDFVMIIGGGETLNYLKNSEETKEIPKNLFKYVNSELVELVKQNEVNIDKIEKGEPLEIAEDKSKIEKLLIKKLNDKIENMSAEELNKLLK